MPETEFAGGRGDAAATVAEVIDEGFDRQGRGGVDFFGDEQAI